MEYTLHINQSRAIDWDLSMGETLLFAYLVLPAGWMKAHPTDGSFRWLSSKKLAQELPLVCAHVASMRRHMKSLEDKGLIDRIVHDSMSYYRVTPKGETWRSPTASMEPPDLPPGADAPPRANPLTPPSESAHPPRANPLTPPSESAHQSVPPDHIHHESGSVDARKPAKPIEWAQHFVTRHGYTMEEAHNGATAPVFTKWIEAGVSIAEVEYAMTDAHRSLGDKPDTPKYLHRIIVGNRKRGETLERLPRGGASRVAGREQPGSLGDRLAAMLGQPAADDASAVVATQRASLLGVAS